MEHPTDPGPADTRQRLLRLVARGVLILWQLFWTWFVISVMATEGIATTPVLMLASFWCLGAVAWRWSCPGAIALVAFAGFSLWYFHNSAAVWLLALPAIVVAALLAWSSRSSHAIHAARA